MFAWRARIGVIKPTHRGKASHFWYNHAPDGVEIVSTFIGFRSGQRQGFLEGFKRAEELAVELKEVGCNIIVVSGTPPFLLKGRDFERQWASDPGDQVFNYPVAENAHTAKGCWVSPPGPAMGGGSTIGFCR